MKGGHQLRESTIDTVSYTLPFLLSGPLKHASSLLLPTTFSVFISCFCVAFGDCMWVGMYYVRSRCRSISLSEQWQLLRDKAELSRTARRALLPTSPTPTCLRTSSPNGAGAAASSRPATRTTATVRFLPGAFRRRRRRRRLCCNEVQLAVASAAAGVGIIVVVAAVAVAKLLPV